MVNGLGGRMSCLTLDSRRGAMEPIMTAYVVVPSVARCGIVSMIKLAARAT